MIIQEMSNTDPFTHADLLKAKNTKNLRLSQC
jgi:hypothetical protein